MKTVPGIVPAFSNMLIFRWGSGPGRSQTFFNISMLSDHELVEAH